MRLRFRSGHCPHGHALFSRAAPPSTRTLCPQWWQRIRSSALCYFSLFRCFRFSFLSKLCLTGSFTLLQDDATHRRAALRGIGGDAPLLPSELLTHSLHTPRRVGHNEARRDAPSWAKSERLLASTPRRIRFLHFFFCDSRPGIPGLTRWTSFVVQQDSLAFQSFSDYRRPQELGVVRIHRRLCLRA